MMTGRKQCTCLSWLSLSKAIEGCPRYHYLLWIGLWKTEGQCRGLKELLQPGNKLQNKDVTDQGQSGENLGMAIVAENWDTKGVSLLREKHKYR